VPSLIDFLSAAILSFLSSKLILKQISGPFFWFILYPYTWGNQYLNPNIKTMITSIAIRTIAARLLGFEDSFSSIPYPFSFIGLAFNFAGAVGSILDFENEQEGCRAKHLFPFFPPSDITP